MPSAGRLWLCVQLNLYLPSIARSLPPSFAGLTFFYCVPQQKQQRPKTEEEEKQYHECYLRSLYKTRRILHLPDPIQAASQQRIASGGWGWQNVAWLSTPIKLWHIPTTFIRQGVYLCGAEQSRGVARAEKGKESHKFSPRHIQRYPPANRLPSRDLSPSRCSLLQLLLLLRFVENQPPMNH